MPRIINYINIKYVSYFLFFIGLFIGGRFAINSLAIFILISIISFFTQGANSWRNLNKLLFLPIVFYSLYFVSVFYSEHKAVAWFDLEVKFSFLLLPIIFGFEKPDKRIKLHTIFTLFSISALIYAVYLIFRGLFLYETNGHFPTYTDFSPSVHVAYLASYFVFSVIINYELICQTTAKKYRLLYSISLFFSVLSIFFADSKAGILIFISLIIAISFIKVFQKSKLLAMLILVVSILFSGVVIMKNERFKTMFDGYVSYKKSVSGNKEYTESTTERIMIWDAAIKLIQDDFWIGIGTGDVKIELEKEYLKLGYDNPARLHLNAHNNYLETLLATGIIGLLSLLAIFFIPMYIQSSTMTIIYNSFIYIVASNILFESMFNTQAGVLFFTFFYSFIIVYNKREYSNKL